MGVWRLGVELDGAEADGWGLMGLVPLGVFFSSVSLHTIPLLFASGHARRNGRAGGASARAFSAVAGVFRSSVPRSVFAVTLLLR